MQAHVSTNPVDWRNNIQWCRLFAGGESLLAIDNQAVDQLECDKRRRS